MVNSSLQAFANNIQRMVARMVPKTLVPDVRRAVSTTVRTSASPCAPHRAVAVGHLALNDGGSQGALAGVVRDLDLAGIIEKGQELIARSADLRLEGPRQVAGARGGEDGGLVPLQGAPLGGQC